MERDLTNVISKLKEKDNAEPDLSEYRRNMIITFRNGKTLMARSIEGQCKYAARIADAINGKTFVTIIEHTGVSIVTRTDNILSIEMMR